MSALPSEGSDQPSPNVELIRLLSQEHLTISDLPDDDHGIRYELIDGGLHVTPLGDFEHQRLAGRLYVQLLAGVPEHLEVLQGVNVIVGGDTLVEPDVAVTDPKHLVRAGLGVSPQGLVLAIEITSPSTARRDFTLKRELYEEWGVPYVVLDRRQAPYSLKTFGLIPEWAQLSLPS